jgi:hypothetical protein
MQKKAGERAGYPSAVPSRDRLAITYPSSRALEPLLHGHGAGDAGEAAVASPDVTSREPPE